MTITLCYSCWHPIDGDDPRFCSNCLAVAGHSPACILSYPSACSCSLSAPLPATEEDLDRYEGTAAFERRQSLTMAPAALLECAERLVPEVRALRAELERAHQALGEIAHITDMAGIGTAVWVQRLADIGDKARAFLRRTR